MVKEPGCKVCHKLGSAIFEWPLRVWIYLLRKGAYRGLFIYHFKAHTISNKLVSKVSAQKKGEKSYDSYKYVSNFCGFRSSHSIRLMKSKFSGYTSKSINRYSCTLFWGLSRVGYQGNIIILIWLSRVGYQGNIIILIWLSRVGYQGNIIILIWLSRVGYQGNIIILIWLSRVGYQSDIIILLWIFLK